jgi:hypothetical protein
MFDKLKDAFKKKPDDDATKTAVHFGDSGQTNIDNETKISGQETNIHNTEQYTDVGSVHPDEGPEEKKKGLVLVGRIALVGIFVYLVYEVILKEEPAPAQKITKKKQARKKGQRPSVVKKKPTQPKQEKTKAIPQKEVVKKEVVKTAPVVESPPVVEKKPEMVKPGPEDEIVTKTTPEPNQPVGEIKPKVEETPPAVVEKAPETKEMPMLDSVTGMDTPEIPVEEKTTQNSDTPSTGSETMEKLNTMIEEQIKQEEENLAKQKEVPFTPPPDYERVGRGLVYNCVGGHWACVDRESFYQCVDHSKWSAANGKKPGCVKYAVYGNMGDCELAQIYHVNTLTKVPSCLLTKSSE